MVKVSTVCYLYGNWHVPVLNILFEIYDNVH